MKFALPKQLIGAVGATIVACLAVVSVVPGASHTSPLSPLLPDGDRITALAKSGTTLFVGGDFTRFGMPTGHTAVVDAPTGRPDAGYPSVSGDFVDAIAADGHGGWFVAGRFRSVGGIRCPYLAHILPDKTLDAGWCPNPDADAKALALSGGTLYVGGFFETIGGKERHLIAALDAGSGAVLPWDPNASGDDNGEGSPGVRAIAVAGGAVYAGGIFSRIGGQRRSLLAALDPETGEATRWNPSPIRLPCSRTPNTPCGTVNTITVAAGSVYVGGSFSRIGGTNQRNLAAVDATTGQTIPWNIGSLSGHSYAVVRSLALSDRTLYAGGEFERVGEAQRKAAAAFDALTGELRPWNPGFDGAVEAIAVDAGKVYAGGWFERAGGQVRYGLAAVDADSGIVTSWDPNPNGTTNAIAAAGGRVAIGGWFTSVGEPIFRNGIAAIDTRSGALTGWTTRRKCRDAGGLEAIAAGHSAIYAAGQYCDLAAFDLRSGQRLRLTPSVKPSHAGLGWCSILSCALAPRGGTVYLAGDFSRVGGQPRLRLAAMNAATGKPTNWDPAPNALVQTVVPTGSVVYVGGDFTRIGGARRDRIAAVDAATGRATPWNPRANGTVAAIAFAGRTIYVAGEFSRIGGQARNGLAAIDAVTGKAKRWNPAPHYPPDPDSRSPNAVEELALVGSTLVVAGYFDRILGTTRDRVAAIDTRTGRLKPWTVSLEGGGVVSAIVAVGPTLYLGGWFDRRLLAVPLAEVTRSS